MIRIGPKGGNLPDLLGYFTRSTMQTVDNRSQQGDIMPENTLASGDKQSNKVFVVGVGMTKFTKPGSTGNDYPELVHEAVTAALNDSKLSYTSIEQAFAGYVYGESTCGQRALYELGMTGIPIFNVNNNCSTGSSALLLAKQIIEGGLSNCVLAVGFEKMAKGSLTSKYDDRTNPMDKHVELLSTTHGIEPAPMTAQLFGAAGKEHMAKYGTKAEHFAKIAWKNHMHSTKNPYAQFQDLYSLEQILSSQLIYEPLTKLQCSPTSDGAAAAILASKNFVLQHGLENQAVEILGMEMATDLPSTLNENSCIKMVGYDMTKKAAETLFQKTGLSPTDVNVIELHDCFSTNELLTYEALGLCEVGKGAELVETGNNTYGGKYVINPSGGLISKGHPLGATGVAQCAELSWHLRNMAGARQVPGATLALQHNIGLGGAVVVALYKLGFPQLSSSQHISAPSYSNFTSTPFFSQMEEFLNKAQGSIDKSISGSVLFRITNESGDNVSWLVSFKDGKAHVISNPQQAGDCTIIVSDSILSDIFSKKVDIQKAFYQGKVKFEGNVGMLMKLSPLRIALSRL